MTQTTDRTISPAPPSTQEVSFQTGQVMTVAGGHFTHDTYSAFIAPLIPLLQEKLSIGYAVAGGLVVYSQLPSLLTPFIGYLADRVSLRYFIILAPAVTATLMSLMGVVSSYFTLVLLMLTAGISIAAFHAPAPAMIARVAGSRTGTGMSVFMAAGELGRTLGPVFVIAGVDWFGLGGIWRLAIVGWLVSAVLYYRLRSISARPVGQNQSSFQSWLPKARQVFPVLAWLVGARVFFVAALTIYLPVFMHDVYQSSLWLSAASLTILEAAGVIGALTTGTISDRLGRSRVLFFLVGLSPIFLLCFLYSPEWLVIPLLIALGLTAITPTPVLLAVVQDEFPNNRALANGTFMALNFVIRAVGIYVVGVLADQFGLVNAFLWSGLLAFISVPATFYLPKKST